MPEDGADDAAADGRPLESVLPPAELSRLGTLLVAGPTAETVGRVPDAALSAAADPGDGAIAVSTRERTSAVFERLAAVGAFAAERVAVVDCTREGPDRTAEDSVVRAVASPSDLTGTGIAIDECIEELTARDVERAHVLYDTLSAPLRSVPAETVLRFVHHLTIEVGILTGLDVCTVYTNVVDDRDLAMLKHLFDGMLEVRRREGRQELRCRGIRGTPDGWVPVDPTASGSGHGPGN